MRIVITIFCLTLLWSCTTDPAKFTYSQFEQTFSLKEDQIIIKDTIDDFLVFSIKDSLVDGEFSEQYYFDFDHNFVSYFFYNDFQNELYNKNYNFYKFQDSVAIFKKNYI